MGPRIGPIVGNTFLTEKPFARDQSFWILSFWKYIHSKNERGAYRHQELACESQQWWHAEIHAP